MTEEHPQQDFEDKERRALTRRMATAEVTLFRDSDLMRNGIDGVLHNISPIGIGLLLPVAVDVEEQVEVVLNNRIQQLEKSVRGTVKHVSQHDPQTCLVGIELRTRLTPVEVSQLRISPSEEL